MANIGLEIPVFTKDIGLDSKTFGNIRVAVRQRACLFALIAGFLAVGSLRLNDCDFFNPDSPRYVIYSQALVDLGAYCATDLPGSPLYSWRPPGLSLLLAPVMWLRPYDVVAAKWVVLLTGAMLLWAVFELTLLHNSFWPAMIVATVIATAPTFLVLSTEVLTEIPYTLGVLVVLLILNRASIVDTSQTDQRRTAARTVELLLAIIALAFTPWLRTAGVALVAAVGIWSLLSRSRLKWLSAVAIAAVGLGLLAWRNKLAAGENYVGSLMSRMRTQGPVAVMISGLDTIWHYVSTLPALLLPGLTSDRAWYSSVANNEFLSVPLPYVVASCITAVLVSLGLLGMCRRRTQGGSLALFYILIYCACLTVWPWRHERFLWPLVPVIMSYLPVGLVTAASAWPAIQPGAYIGGTAVLLALCGWQGLNCHTITRVNQQFVASPDQFLATSYPEFYFNGWRQAGQWLNSHTPPSARVLTWHAAVAGTSHRFQKRSQFENLNPDLLRKQIEGFSARYLVVSLAQFGDGFNWQQLQADPAITLNVVYRERDVAILEVTPNRSGEVSKDAYPAWLDRQLQNSEAALQQFPNRTDLAIRYASLLREADRDQEAIKVFRNIFDQGIRTARVCAELGWLYLEDRQYSEAARFLDIARGLPNAESIANVLSDSAAHARKMMKDLVSADENLTIKRKLNKARTLINLLKYAAAESILTDTINQHPDLPDAIFLRGLLHHRLGELVLAEADYERAISNGITEAQSWLTVIRFAKAIEQNESTIISAGQHQETVNPAIHETHVRMATLYQQHGWAGRALATLESANTRFVRQPAIQLPLADLYRSFGMPDQAIPLYESVLAIAPSEKAARKGLQSAQYAMLEPDMHPLTSQADSQTVSGHTRVSVSHR